MSGSFRNLPEESAEDLYENAPCGYISFFADGTIFKINQTLLDLVGFQRDELINKKRIQDLFKIGGKIYFETHFFPLIQMQGFVKEINFDFRKKDGTSFPALINVDQVTNSQSGISIYRASVLDITDRKNYEKALLEGKAKAEKATRAKAEFLSTISHEIRTPLNAIVGIGNLIQQTSLDEKQQEYAKILQISSENLLELVNNLLDLSKLEAHKVKVVEKAFSLKDLLEMLNHSFKLKAAENNIELLTEFPEDLPDNLLGDPIKLNQVLTNLLGNAVKFTSSGYVKLSIEILEEQQKNIFLKFIVSDTGIGIPKDKLEVIFKEFSQASYDVNLEFGGTGLGLTISQKLLRMHGSELTVRSEEGKGSEFSFDLKFKRSGKSTKVKSQKSEYTKILKDSRAKVLIVDDNKTNLFITSSYLQGWHVENTTVSSGPSAIDAVQKEDFDIILMDLHMPKMNGYETSLKIREMDLPSQPAIIALSASGKGDINLKMKRAGINARVPKPFNPKELQEVLVNFLFRNPKTEPSEIVRQQEQRKIIDPSKNKNTEKTFGISRYVTMSKGNSLVLQKWIGNAVKSLRIYREEYSTSINNRDAEQLEELMHKNTMALYYLETERLNKFLNSSKELLNDPNTKTKGFEQIKIEVLTEFDKIIKGLQNLSIPE